MSSNDQDIAALFLKPQ